MSDRIPPEFEQGNPERRSAGADSSADFGPASASGAGTGGAGYGGYGYGYGGTTGGESDFSFVHYLQIIYRRRYVLQIIYRRRYVATTAFLVVALSAALYTFWA